MTQTPISLAIGADHRGFLHKEYLLKCTHTLDKNMSFVWHDVGSFDHNRSDYPAFAHAALKLVQEGVASYAVLLCGTGIGMAIAANRLSHVYAGVVWREDVARKAREDDNVNVLVIPADYVSVEVMQACFLAWVTATFKGGRYEDRLQQID